MDASMELVAPHARAAVRLEGRLEMEFAWRVLEEIDYGLVLVSPTGTLQHANLIARHELSRGRFLRVEQSKVVGNSEAHTEVIVRGVRGATQGRRQMLTLRNGEDSLSVACVPLFQPYERDTPSVLLMLARQVGTQNLAIAFFSRTHGLTPTEESVLKALCEGLAVHEIANANGVSVNTVRTQVRSLRDKTGIHSMRLLVQKVGALPPVVPVGLTAFAGGIAG
jgi:DNA-binding CsgD family transcriptional regulator